MSPITTHVLDIAKGKPAAGIPVSLDLQAPAGNWRGVGHGVTNQDGRVTDFLASEKLDAGTYWLTFDTSSYLQHNSGNAFFPLVTIVFAVQDASQHYHIPLLLSPYGYSTYRGS